MTTFCCFYPFPLGGNVTFVPPILNPKDIREISKYQHYNLQRLMGFLYLITADIYHTLKGECHPPQLQLHLLTVSPCLCRD